MVRCAHRVYQASLARIIISLARISNVSIISPYRASRIMVRHQHRSASNVTISAAAANGVMTWAWRNDGDRISYVDNIDDGRIGNVGGRQ